MNGLEDINILMVLVFVVLIAAVPNKVRLPEKMYDLVDNKTNLVLLFALCLLVSYCHFPLGVMMSIFVFVVYLHKDQREGFENKVEDVDATQEDTKNDTKANDAKNNAKNNASKNDVKNDVDTDEVSDAIQKLAKATKGKKVSEMDDDEVEAQVCPHMKVIGESDLAGKCMALMNNVQMPNQPKNEVADNVNYEIPEDVKSVNNLNNADLSSSNTVENFTGKQNNDDDGYEAYDTMTEPMTNFEEEGFVGKQIREQFANHRSSGYEFDVVGCRYDQQGNLDNEYIQGPPVDKCDNYNRVSLEKIGTTFYPINP